MIELTQPERAEIEDVVLLSNTPRYMVKHLRRLAQVQRIGDLPPSRVVQEFIDALAQQAEPLCYAILASTLSKSAPEAAQLLDQLDVASLRWGPSVKSIVLATSTARGATKWRVADARLQNAPDGPCQRP